MFSEPLSLKKRYLRSLISSNDITTNSVNQSLQPESTTSSLATTCETITNEASTSQTNFTNEPDKFIKTELEMQVNRSPKVVQLDVKTTRTSEHDCRTLSLGQELTEGYLRPLDSTQQSYISRGTLGIVPDMKPVVISTAPVQRTIDPRQQSPSSSIQSSPTTPSQSTVVTPVPTSTITQSSDVSSGTPGKKKAINTVMMMVMIMIEMMMISYDDGDDNGRDDD